MKQNKRNITVVMLLFFILTMGTQTAAATKTYTMYVGNFYKIKQSKVLEWVSSDTKIAKVEKISGMITPLRQGTVTIKAEKKRSTKSFKVIVKKPYISQTKMTLEVGKTSMLKLVGITEEAWKSSDSSIVSVSSSGEVKANAPGTAVITVTGSNEKLYQCRITVPQPYIPPEPEPQPPIPQMFNGYLIMHRGYNKEAPENTLAAFRLAAEKGYKYVECDIQFTKDGVPVILHDITVTRTSNAASVTTEKYISNMTFEEVRQLDFGSWKSPEYAGEKIPSFQEFLQLCQQYGLHPYIELKSKGNYSSKLKDLYEIAASMNMQNQVTWISSDIDLLNIMKKLSPTAELGWMRSSAIKPSTIAGARAIQLPTNKVYLMPKLYYISYEMMVQCWKYNIGLISQSVNSNEGKGNLNSYFTAALTNGI